VTSTSLKTPSRKLPKFQNLDGVLRVYTEEVVRLRGVEWWLV